MYYGSVLVSKRIPDKVDTIWEEYHANVLPSLGFGNYFAKYPT